MRRKITKRLVDSLEPGSQRQVVTDTELKGFGVRVQPGGTKAFYVQYRMLGAGRGGRPRTVTLGSYGALTVEQARSQAKRLLGRVAHGNDPAGERKARRQVPTVEQLGVAFLDDVRARRKTSTAKEHVRRWALHIVPALGTRKVGDVTAAHVAALHRRLRDRGPYEANRTRALLGAFFTYAMQQGVCALNPANEIEDFPEAPRERFLTPEEVARLGAALRAAEREGLPPAPSKSRGRVTGPTAKHRPPSADALRPADPVAIAAIRFLLFSGWREQEGLTLRWSQVDLARGVAVLPSTKTGRSVRRLGAPAVLVVAQMPRVEGCPFVFPGRNLTGPRREITRTWYAVRHAAALEDVRLHDLRHSFASAAASGGGSLPMIGALLGHVDSETTQRYSHLLEDPVQQVADAAAGQLSAWLDPPKALALAR